MNGGTFSQILTSKEKIATHVQQLPLSEKAIVIKNITAAGNIERLTVTQRLLEPVVEGDNNSCCIFLFFLFALTGKDKYIL